MYRELVARLSEDCKFQPCCEDHLISSAENSLSVVFPEELRSLLAESNGIEGDGYGLNLIWSIDEVVERNQDFRKNEDFEELYMPFDCLLFFGDAGNGDQFGYAIRKKKIDAPDIYCWNHEDDSRTWCAPNLELFITWWYEGKIST